MVAKILGELFIHLIFGKKSKKFKRQIRIKKFQNIKNNDDKSDK